MNYENSWYILGLLVYHARPSMNLHKFAVAHRLSLARARGLPAVAKWCAKFPPEYLGALQDPNSPEEARGSELRELASCLGITVDELLEAPTATRTTYQHLAPGAALLPDPGRTVTSDERMSLSRLRDGVSRWRANQYCHSVLFVDKIEREATVFSMMGRFLEWRFLSPINRRLGKRVKISGSRGEGSYSASFTWRVAPVGPIPKLYWKVGSRFGNQTARFWSDPERPEPVVLLNHGEWVFAEEKPGVFAAVVVFVGGSARGDGCDEHERRWFTYIVEVCCSTIMAVAFSKKPLGQIDTVAFETLPWRDSLDTFRS